MPDQESNLQGIRLKLRDTLEKKRKDTLTLKVMRALDKLQLISMKEGKLELSYQGKEFLGSAHTAYT